MKIWFFNHYAVPPTLYPLTRTYNFGKFLIQGGHSVKVFAASTVHNSDINLANNSDNYMEETIDGIEHVFLTTSNYKTNGLDRVINMIQYTLGLFKVTKKFDSPDIIVASSVHPLACVAGIKIAKKYKCSCVVEIADLWPLTLIDFGKISQNGLIAKVLYRLEHWIYINANEIVFTMEGGKDYIIDTFENEKQIDLSKIHYINNGIDINKFNSQKNDCHYEDVDLDDQNIFKVVYTGSLGEANATHYLVESAKIIQMRGYKNIKFIIFGSGYKRSELEDYCKTNDLKNVVFKGRVDKKYIPNILSKSNLNLFTGEHISLYKYGISLNKLFDYMASGKPTISNIVCGYDNLTKYQCGITVAGGSAEYLADGIISFYNMPQEQYNRYCNNAIEASKMFDFKKLTKKLEDILLNNVDPSNPPVQQALIQ